MVDDGGTDWAGYYAASAGRGPRPLLLAACEELGAGQDRLAIDLGCGEGTDALELLARGWSVLAVDAEPAGLSLLRARIPPPAAGRVRVLCAPFAEADLPRAHLIHAGFSLPFCPPQEFPALWARIRQALAPGGVFAGQLFGTRDTWADDPDMTFHARHQAETLLDGLDILRLEETERDGHAFSGPKHWHTFDILARKPISKQLRQHPALATDVNHGHLATAVVAPDGNILGIPATLPLNLAGLPATTRDGHLRAAISSLIATALACGARAIVIEDLDFAGARAEGRERHGNRPCRGRRGRGFRRAVAGIPTALPRPAGPDGQQRGPAGHRRRSRVHLPVGG